MLIEIPYEYEVKGERRGLRGAHRHFRRDVVVRDVPEIGAGEVDARLGDVFPGDWDPPVVVDGRTFLPVGSFVAGPAVAGLPSRLLKGHGADVHAERVAVLMEEVSVGDYLPYWSIRGAEENRGKATIAVRSEFSPRSKPLRNVEWSDEDGRRRLAEVDADCLLAIDGVLHTDRYQPAVCNRGRVKASWGVAWVDRLGVHDRSELAPPQEAVVLPVDVAAAEWRSMGLTDPGTAESWARPSLVSAVRDGSPLREVLRGSALRHDLVNARLLAYRACRQAFMNFGASPVAGSGDMGVADGSEDIDDAFFSIRSGIRAMRRDWREGHDDPSAADAVLAAVRRMINAVMLEVDRRRVVDKAPRKVFEEMWNHHACVARVRHLETRLTDAPRAGVMVP